MREDYQELIDEVSALLGTPATLEGRDFGLIAFGAHTSHDGDGPDLALDPVRTRSILQRRSTAQVRAWFESFGITRVTGPVRIPPDPSAGVVHGRICLPVRHSGVAHGYIWLLDDSELDLGDARMAAAMTTAARIGTLLAAEARVDARTGELLQQLLSGTGGPRSRDEAAAELRGALGATASGPLALVAVTPWRTGDSAHEQVTTAGLPNVAAQCVLRSGTADGPADGEEGVGRQDRNDLAEHEADDRPAALAALVRLRTPDGLDPARAAAETLLRSPYSAATRSASLAAAPSAARSAAPHDEQAAAGVSAPHTGIAQLRAAWREARGAARAARAESALGPVAEWGTIGPFRLLTALPGGAQPDPVLRTLRLPAHRELARTAEVFLDRAGQAGRAAAALGIHRQTLYYRLSRVEQLTGLDLDDGEHRLLLHMALKAVRL